MMLIKIACFAIVLFITIDAMSLPAAKTLECLCDGGAALNLKGCFISVPSRPNKACRCYEEVQMGRDKCFGEEVNCIDLNSSYCKYPDTSKASCLQAANSNCLGYP